MRFTTDALCHAFLWLNLADAETTLWLVSNGLGTEFNPVLRRMLLVGDGTFFAAKMAVAVFVVALAYAVRAEHKSAARNVMTGCCIGMAAVVLSNMAQVFCAIWGWV